MSKAFFGRVDGSDWAIKLTDLDNSFLLKPLGQRTEWNQVNAWKLGAKKEWIRTKREGSTTALLRRWLKMVGATEYFVKYNENDDSVEVFYKH